MKDYYQKARDKSIFKHMVDYFGDNATLKEVEEKLGGYQHFRSRQITNRNKPPYSGTIRKELKLLSRMFNVARKQWKWKITNSVSEIELPKDSSKRVRYLKSDEYTNLFFALEKTDEKWLEPLVIVALETGLREGNLCELTWDDVNFFNRSIFLDAMKMKNDDYHGIPLTDKAYETLKKLHKVQCISSHVFHDNGKKLYERKIQRAFRKVLHRAGIKDFRFHDLRHSFASYLR